MRLRGRKLRYQISGYFGMWYLNDKNRWVMFDHTPWYIKSRKNTLRYFDTRNKAFAELKKLTEIGFDVELGVYKWNKRANRFVHNKTWIHKLEDKHKKISATSIHESGILRY